jgi:hypothetical protein
MRRNDRRWSRAFGNMKALVTAISVGFTLGASPGFTDTLHPLKTIKNLPSDCGCTFHVVPPGEPCVYDADDVLFLVPHSKAPYALVNIGGGNTLLRPIQPLALPLFQCTEGTASVSEWRSNAIGIRLDLQAQEFFANQCFFKGTLQTSRKNRTESHPIKGYCGCFKRIP